VFITKHLYTLVFSILFMVKVQEIVRKSGTRVFVLYLPVDVVKDCGFVKGVVVDVSVSGPGELRIVKVGDV
jgi:hypothetical protein